MIRYIFVGLKLVTRNYTNGCYAAQKPLLTYLHFERRNLLAGLIQSFHTENDIKIIQTWSDEANNNNVKKQKQN